MGDPLDSKTTVGPLVRDSQRQALAKQVEDARSKGGRILAGGQPVKRDGFFYEPTIISNVNHEMEVVKEEVFGPAAPIIIVNNEEEAVREANNSEFGLGASIWTNNIDRGIKKSGIGRELSEFGIKEFVNIKSVVVKDITSKLLVE
jgi:acyl-CoA reductase-like NAD-dependent aldehyde dehydrogenase